MDLRVGLVSGIPFSLKTTVVSKGDIRPISDTTLGISVSSTTVKNNNLFKFLDEAVEVPVGQVGDGAVPLIGYKKHATSFALTDLADLCPYFTTGLQHAAWKCS